MAIMKIDVYAKTMNRIVTLEVIAPLEILKPGQKMAGLYLLHGVQGSFINWSTAVHAFRLLGVSNMKQERKLALIMVSGDNSFYHNAPDRSADYERFIAEELPELTRAMLPLSAAREDTCIAGLSMGGYGALRIGLLYPQVFGFAGGLSSALLTQDMENQVNEAVFFRRRAFLETVFGCSLEGIGQTEHDVMELSHRLVAKIEAEKAAGEVKTQMPKLYVACGEQDGLLPLSRELHADWERIGIKHCYEEHEGDHEWAFWEWGLGRILEYIYEDQTQ